MNTWEALLNDQPRETRSVRRSFPTTRWSLVLAAGQVRGQSSDEALANLCEIYWPAVYTYARYRGYGTNDAEDLTQGFFAKLLEKSYVRQADRERGKFRTFLLSSFKNYMANEWDRTQAQKRGGGQWFVSLDFTDAEGQIRIEPADEATPETIFAQRWARTLLDRVLDQLREEVVGVGGEERFDRMKCCLTGSEPSVPYRQLAADLDMSESAVKVAVHRMRQRFARLVRQEVEHTVDNEDALADKIRYLIETLAS